MKLPEKGVRLLYMGKLIKLHEVRKIRVMSEKEPAKPKKHYKFGEISKYIYDYNLRDTVDTMVKFN